MVATPTEVQPRTVLAPRVPLHMEPQSAAGCSEFRTVLLSPKPNLKPKRPGFLSMSNYTRRYLGTCHSHGKDAALYHRGSSSCAWTWTVLIESVKRKKKMELIISFAPNAVAYMLPKRVFSSSIQEHQKKGNNTIYPSPIISSFF